ncbi:MAG: hypothetical protein ABI583_06750 [Betaproteobacteria bacterium]
MKITQQFGAVVGAVALACTLAIAQSPVNDASHAAVQLPATILAAPGPLPIIDRTKELKGATLITALRKGGFVLYMRHTEAGTPAEKCDQNSLSATGLENARSVGAAIRDLSIPIGAVRSSVPCRTNITAVSLGLGVVEVTEDLNPTAPRPDFDLGAARSARLNEAPPAGTNTILVSHLHGSRNKDEWVHLELGEIIVFRPVVGARAEPVARIRVAKWPRLLVEMAGADKR